MATRSKLAVILHADVVGSTALVQVDEGLAHERIRKAFEQLSGTIARYGGTAHEVRGDALVAEFNRASDAVTASLAFQVENRSRNEGLSGEIRPEVRVGIALGEVVIADQTITGAGVVLAQRLEQLAEPGGVCLQGAVQESVPKRFPFDYEDLGVQSLKGFDEPVRAFTVALRHGDVLPAAEIVAHSDSPTRRAVRRRAAAVGVALILAVTGLFAWWQPWTKARDAEVTTARPTASATDGSQGLAKVSSNKDEDEGLSLPDNPSIAVLAFNNLSNDPEQDYFAEGIAEDIITDLSKIPALLVIARNSSFSYKGKNIPIKDIARELGVAYVLEGSVRRAGNSIRINAQLIDARTEGHLWAERYDGNLKNVFELQDNITTRIVAALSVHLSAESKNDLKRTPTSVPEAYDAFLRGKRNLHVRDYTAADSIAKARAEFQRAVDLDPNYAQAYAGLGWSYWNDYGYLNPLDRSLNVKALELAEKSLALFDNALARRLLAKQFFVPDSFGVWGVRSKKLPEAVTELRKGVALEPNNADALAELAYTLVFAGELDEATELIRKAVRLNPNFPAWYHRPAGIAHYLSGRYGRAVAEFKAWYESETLPKESIPWLAAAYAQEGEIVPSRKTIRELVEKGEMGSQEQIANQYFFVRDRDRQLFMDGLRKAGLRSVFEE